MRGKFRGENDRAQARSSKLKELWGARPLAGCDKTPENKRLSRRIERHVAKGILLRNQGA